jgi:PKD repeat protein
MNTRQYFCCVFALAVSGIWLFYTGEVVARPDGISGFSGANGSTCTACHSAGVNPSVSLRAVSGNTTVAPGSVTSYTFTLSGGPASNAGFDIAASSGALINTNPSGAKILNGELVQSSPNSMSGGSVTWSFDWQAPTAAGTYTIYAAGLSGNGNGGTSGDSTGAASMQVTVAQATNQPPTARISAPTSGAAGVAVTFNGSGSSDPDGSIAGYAWNFGDNTGGATGAQVSHTFAAGTYTVSLTVTDNAGASNTASMQIVIAAANIPPTAAISGPGNGTEGVAVTFDGSGSTDSDGAIVSYSWNFGDNSAGSGAIVDHTFAAGSYTVTLTVTDNDGAVDQAIFDINVVPATSPQPPAADAGGPYNGTVGVAVQFDGSASTDPDGNIANYAWTFGDGNTGTGVGPVHIYDVPGTYIVQLTVTDNNGQQGTGQTTASIVAVEPPPPPPDQPTGTEGEVLYNTYCASCHGQKGTADFDDEIRGEDAGDILEAISEEREMRFLADVITQNDIEAIADYINGGITPPDDENENPPPDDGDNKDGDEDEDEDDSDHTQPPDGNDNDTGNPAPDGDGDSVGSGDSAGNDEPRNNDDSSAGDDKDEERTESSMVNPFDTAQTTSVDSIAPVSGGGSVHWLSLLALSVLLCCRRRFAKTAV